MQIIVSEKTELKKNFLGTKAQQKYGENILVTFESILAKLF
ncbi:hypothetical protein [Sphingobacterium sp. WOUb80]